MVSAKRSVLPSATDFLFAERQLAATHLSEIDLYHAAQLAAERLVPTDAFYVCLIQRRPDWLHFVYNCEGAHFDKPEPYPFGNGPTSLVATEGRPVVLGCIEDREGLDLVPFANPATVSGSAIHFPMWINAAPSDLPDGVLSVQAYATDAYSTEHVEATEWLSLRLASTIRNRDATKTLAETLQGAAQDASRNRAIEDVRRFVTLLDEIVLIRDDPDRLLSETRRIQVELTQWAPTAPVASDELSRALTRLSSRELEVLAYVAQGMSNKEVANVLFLSEHTVKRHLDSVYRQTPLRNRAEVASAAQAIYSVRMTRLGHKKAT